MPARDSVLVWSVNATPLDLRVLAEPFERVVGDATVRRQWFADGLV